MFQLAIYLIFPSLSIAFSGSLSNSPFVDISTTFTTPITAFDSILTEFSSQQTLAPPVISEPATNTITALSTTSINEPITVTLNNDQAAILQARHNILQLIQGLSENTTEIQPIQPLFDTFENAVQKITTDLLSYNPNVLGTSIDTDSNAKEIVIKFSNGALSQVSGCIGDMNTFHSALEKVQFGDEAVGFLKSLVKSANQLINQVGTDCKDSGVNDLITQANSIWATSFPQISEPSSCRLAVISANTTGVLLNTTGITVTATAISTNQTTNNPPIATLSSISGPQETSGETSSASRNLLSLLELYNNLIIVGLFVLM